MASREGDVWEVWVSPSTGQALGKNETLTSPKIWVFEDFQQTYNFIIKIALAGAHDLSIWGFSPYPGTELFDKLSLQNRVKIDDEFYDSLRTYADQSKITSYSENFSNKGLKFLRVFGVVLFYSVSFLRRPIRPFLIARNFIKGTQESRMDMGIADAIRRMSFYPKTN